MPLRTDIEQAAAAIRAGALVGFPTETVYGLGADATRDDAVARVYEAKGRPSFNPLITHVASLHEALALGAFSPLAQRLAQAFWPGPLTVVVPRAAGCPVSLLASAGLPSIALRMPDHSLALALIGAAGRPLVAPSANPSGRISPTTAEHVRLGLGGKVAAVLDGGPCRVGVESTVVSFLEDGPKLLRPGGLERSLIESTIGAALVQEADPQQPHAPGQMASHYAPRAALRLNVSQPRADEAYLGFGSHAAGPYSLSTSGDLVEAAANLFRMLHDIDATGIAHIAVAPIPHAGLGEAINDRLARAAAPRSST